MRVSDKIMNRINMKVGNYVAGFLVDVRVGSCVGGYDIVLGNRAQKTT